jgi:hypothetical protein
MNDTPRVKFNPGDFLVAMAGCSPHEMAVYTFIVMRVVEKNEPVKNDPVRLARASNMGAATCKKALWQLINSETLIDVDGYLWPPRIDRWLLKQDREYISKAVRDYVYERDADRCRYCGTEDGPFHLDHIHPVALGGDNDPENLAVACAACNLSKGAKPLNEWLQ